MMDPVNRTLETYLDLLSSRQRLVASNIANLDTPGFRARDIDFQAELNAALSGTSPKTRGAFGEPARNIQEVEGLAVKNDGNNVSLEREARLLGENAMRFEMASAMMGSRFRMIRMAIKEGNAG